MAKVILKNQSKAGGFTIPDLKTSSSAVVNRIFWYWYRERKDQWNRIEMQEVSPHMHNQLIFNKRIEIILAERLVCSINAVGTIG